MVLPLGTPAVLALPVRAEGTVRTFDAIGFTHVEAEQIGAPGLFRPLLPAAPDELSDFAEQAHLVDDPEVGEKQQIRKG